jgi:hypothetical protein
MSLSDLPQHARPAVELAVSSYKRAMADGVDREVALDIALAPLRSACPDANEVEIRLMLTGALAEECVAAEKAQP